MNREAVRILAIEHGLKKAAELSGVPYTTVRQWSVRGQWKAVPSHSNGTVTNVTTGPADALQAELQGHERETRLSLARSSARMAKDAETVTLRDSKHVLNVAKTAAITHRWEGQDKQQTNVMVNVALLGIRPEEMSENVNTASTIDDDAR